jgi:TonB family protein
MGHQTSSSKNKATQSRTTICGIAAVLIAGRMFAQDSKPLLAPASPGQAIQDAARASGHDLPQDRPKGGVVATLYGAEGRIGTAEILSSTQGVDLGPYVEKVLADVRRNWYHLVPAYASTMKGKVTIEFAVLPDGRIAAMKLVSGSGYDFLDRAAWEGIKATGPFPRLPEAFAGNLKLRFRFLYNRR